MTTGGRGMCTTCSFFTKNLKGILYNCLGIVTYIKYIFLTWCGLPRQSTDEHFPVTERMQ